MDIVTTFSQDREVHPPSEYHQYSWFQMGETMRFIGDPTLSSIGNFCYFIRKGFVVGRAEIIDVRYVENEPGYYFGGATAPSTGYMYYLSPNLELLKPDVRNIRRDGFRGFIPLRREEQLEYEDLFSPENLLTEREIRKLAARVR